MADGVEQYSSWTVDQLKSFLREQQIPLTGNKEELIKKIADIVYMDRLEEEIEASLFQCVDNPFPPSFDELPSDNWTNDDFPLITETRVSVYLKARSGYTKIFKLEFACVSVVTYLI